MKKIVILALATLFPVAAAQAQGQMDYIAQAVSTLQATNARCGFGLSDDAILSASTKLGGQPSDPSFVAAVAERRAVFEASFVYVTDDMLPELCRDSRSLLAEIGL